MTSKVDTSSNKIWNRSSPIKPLLEFVEKVLLLNDGNMSPSQRPILATKYLHDWVGFLSWG